MIQPVSLQVYLLLLRILCQPANWMIWLIIAGVGLPALGLLNSYLIRLDYVTPTFVIVGCGLLVVYILAIAAFLPGQVAAIGSSKQFSVLPNLRRAVLITVLALACLISVGLFYGVNEWSKRAGFANNFFAIFLMMSAILISTIYLSSRLPGAYPFVFFIFVINKDLIKWLMTVDAGWIALVTFFLWLAFSLWWKFWKPVRYCENIAIKTFTEQSWGGADAQDWFFGLPSCKPTSLVGTLLLGVADSVAAHMARAAVVLLWFVLAFAAANIFQVRPLEDLKHIEAIFICLILVLASLYSLHSVARNFHKIWLFVDSSGSAMFVAEKFLTNWMLMCSLVVAGVFCGLELRYDLPVISYQSILLAVVESWLLTAAMLYAQLIIYSKRAGNMAYNSWLQTGVCVLLPASALLPPLSFAVTFSPVAVIFLIGILQLAAIFYLRLWALRALATANFVRIKG